MQRKISRFFKTTNKKIIKRFKFVNNFSVDYVNSFKVDKNFLKEVIRISQEKIMDEQNMGHKSCELIMLFYDKYTFKLNGIDYYITANNNYLKPYLEYFLNRGFVLKMGERGYREDNEIITFDNLDKVFKKTKEYLKIFISW